MNLVAALTIICSSSIINLSEEISDKTCGYGSACLGVTRIYRMDGDKCFELANPGQYQTEPGTYCAIAGELGEKALVEKATLDKKCKIKTN